MKFRIFGKTFMLIIWTGSQHNLNLKFKYRFELEFKLNSNRM
jgi:hypothetical protein